MSTVLIRRMHWLSEVVHGKASTLQCELQSFAPAMQQNNFCTTISTLLLAPENADVDTTYFLVLYTIPASLLSHTLTYRIVAISGLCSILHIPSCCHVSGMSNEGGGNATAWGRCHGDTHCTFCQHMRTVCCCKVFLPLGFLDIPGYS